MKFGLAIVFDGDLASEGYRGDLTPILYAVYDGKHERIYSDLEFIPRLSRITQFPIEEFNADGPYIGHNLPTTIALSDTIDLLRVIKEASADVLQSEGKRFSLGDLCRWNRVRGFHQEIASAIKKYASYRKGDYHKVARLAVEEARRCYELGVAVRKRGRVRFVDHNTGKLAYADISFGEEE
jgi:hypothetical protein